MNEEQKVELKLIHMEEVVSKEVSWLWYPYIPYGKITVIEGDPGEGKTTLVEEYANAVEGKREIQAGNSFRGLLTALGELLNSFKELIVDGICWFPRLMRWQTSKGEVAPVFSDYRNEGYNYRLVAYQNLVTKEQYSVESVQEEIKAENRVGTLEQLERRIEETEVLVRKLHKDKMR